MRTISQAGVERAPRRRRAPARWAPRRACRRAGGGRSGTRRPRRSRRPHLAVDAASATALHRLGIEAPGRGAYIASRQRPEVVAAWSRALGRAAQVALEGVRVRVGHRRRSWPAAHRERPPAHERVARRGGVVEVDRLLGRVADAARVAREDHRRAGSSPAEDARVVAGEAQRRPPGRRSAARSARVELDAVRARRRPVSSAPVAARLLRAPRGQRRAGRLRRAASSHSRTCAAIVVSALGSTSIRDAVTTMSVASARSVGGDDQARGGSERVAALVAARRARVVGAAVQVGLHAHARGEPAHAHDRRERSRSRRLVDVQLEEAAQAPQPLPAPARRPPGRRRRRPSRRPARRRRRRGGRARRRRRARPTSARRAEGRRVEARALLVGEGDHRHRARRSATANAGAHAERAVVAPAAAHAVEVRADAPPRRRRVGHRPAVAGRVALDAQPDLARALRANHAPAASSSARPGQPRGAAARRGRSARGRPGAARDRRPRSRVHPPRLRPGARRPPRRRGRPAHTGLRPKR